MHTHTGKKSMFMYGANFPLHSEHYLKVRVLPKLLAELTVMLRYYSCRFKAENDGHRLAANRDLRLPPKSYTFEVSSFGFIDKDRRTVNYNQASLMLVGCRLAFALNEHAGMLE